MTTVYTRPECIQCDRTTSQLTKKAVPFEITDVTTDAQAYAYITETLGYRQAPVVVTDDGQHWSGYRPDKLAQLASTQHSPNAAEITSPTINSAHLDH